jgi:peptide/nickel transport system permease protein
VAKYILKRLLIAIPLLLVITIICFALMHLAPYDAIDAMTSPKMSVETVALIKAKYGYDQPLAVQYVRWLGGLLSGNFGYSIVSKSSIADALAVRLPNTILLVLPSYLTAYALSILLGLYAGSHRNSRADKIIDGLASLGIALPTFWFSMMLIFVFGYLLKALPIVGMSSVGDGSPADLLRHYLMPYVTLVVAFLPDLLRYVRSSTITQSREDYVMVQTAFGATKREIMFRHVCKNVLTPVLTKLGMAMPLLITGAVITESVFGWPGVGPYFISAIKGMDYPIVMIVLVLSSTFVILGNLVSDILVASVDPRIRKGGVA